MNAYIPELKNKTVLVTGAGVGIGRSIALAAHQAGAIVGIHYAHSKDAAAEVVEMINNLGGSAISLAGDLTNKNEAQRVVEDFTIFSGQLDGLVNNAGGLLQRTMIEDLQIDLLHKAIAVNVETAILTSQAALPYFREAGSGAIVNISSIAAFQGVSTAAHYAASKAMLSSFSRSMAVEWAHDNIRVNALSPGVILTRFHEIHSTSERLDKMLSATPMGRHGQSDEIAGAAIFLLSDASSFITGANIDINGGRYIP